MRRFDLSTIDHRMVAGAAISVASLVITVVGLFAVVSALTDDPVHLPDEGNIEEILQDNASSSGDIQVAAPIPGASPAPTGPRPSGMGVPKLNIEASVVALGFEPNSNNPAVPEDGGLVAWYDFTTAPNLNNNAVFAGHVDWQTADGRPIPGVFYRLRELRIGDAINLTLEDGSKVAYVVTGNVATKYDDPNVVRAMEPTSKDVITIITCGGSWVSDPSKETGGNYTHRIIVRAEKVVGAVAALAGS